MQEFLTAHDNGLPDPEDLHFNLFHEVNRAAKLGKCPFCLMVHEKVKSYNDDSTELIVADTPLLELHADNSFEEPISVGLGMMLAGNQGPCMVLIRGEDDDIQILGVDARFCPKCGRDLCEEQPE
jgi:hypothetical protein